MFRENLTATNAYLRKEAVSNDLSSYHKTLRKSKQTQSKQEREKVRAVINEAENREK